MITNWTWQITPGGTLLYGGNVSYQFTHPGTYTVTLTVTDTTGDQDMASRTLSFSTPSEDTPGFALIILILSLTSVLILKKKRRLM
jgi:PKD repeat protein